MESLNITLSSSAIFAQFTLKMCVAARNRENPLKPFVLGSFKVVDIDTFKKLLISVCYDKQHVCTYL